MPNANDEVANLLTAHSIDLSRFESHLIRKAVFYLKELERELIDELISIDPTAPKRTYNQNVRLELLFRQVLGTLRTAYNRIDSTMHSELRELAELELELMNNTYNKVFQASVTTVAISPELTKSIVDEQYIDGELLGRWLNRQRGDLKERFRREIRNGMLRSESLNQIVKRLRGTPTGKRTKYIDAKGNTRVFQEYEGGIIQAPKRNLEALARTATQSISNEAHRKFYEQNEKFFKGTQAITTLDFRTSDICISRTGAIWDKNGNPVKNTNEKFPGYPPWHWNCRSLVIGVLKEFNELGLSKNKVENVPGTVKSSLDGEVADDTTYSQWLKSQPVELQKEKLGPTKFKLWKEGNLKLRDLVDQFGRPLSVKQLREKYE